MKIHMSTAAITMAVVALAMHLMVPPRAAAQFYNIDNTPFNTICSGPQGVVVVDVADPTDNAAISTALRTKFSVTRGSLGSSRASRHLAFLRRAKLVKGTTIPAIDYTVFLRSNGRIVTSAPSATRAEGDDLTFTYQGFTVDEQAKLQAFANIVYPVAKEVYGSPMRSINVTVLKEGTTGAPVLGDREATFIGGIYVASTTPRQLVIPFGSNTNLQFMEKAFLRLILRAFHDDRPLGYPAWEEGFIRAASVVIGRRVSSALASAGLPGLGLEDDSTFSILPWYDLLNQAPLGNNTFTPPSLNSTNPDVYGDMLLPRLGMSAAAWLKVYTEYRIATGQHFFSAFNAAYYAGAPSLPNSIPALKLVAAGLTPQVEGIAFDEWYRRQWILNTSVSIGKKLFAYNIPIPDDPDVPDADFSVIVFLIHYNTTQSGDELPLNGVCFPVFWNWTFDADLFPGAQSEQIDIVNGQGPSEPTFFTDTLGGAQRITIDFTVNNETARVVFPAGVAGTVAAPSSFYGAVLGSEGGSLTVTAADPPSSPPGATATQGVFAVDLSAGLSDLNQVTMTYTSGLTTVTRKVNTGYGSYVALLDASSLVKTLPHAFDASLQMVTFPVTALERDQAAALGIEPSRLLLAHWRPDIAGANKYELYNPTSPQIAPIVPGRGYWLKLAANATLNATGEVADPAIPYRIGLQLGWNQIGSPFRSLVPITGITVESGNNEPITLDQAIAQGLVGNTVWGYSPSTRQYVAASALNPWEGYWIKCNAPTGAVLVIPASQAFSPLSRAVTRSLTTKAARTLPAGGKLDWKIEIAATRTDGGAATARMGMAAGATDGFDNVYDTESPPAYESGLSLAFKLPTRSDSAFYADVRSSGVPAETWDMQVDAGGTNKDVVLTWPNLSSAPKKYRFMLVDMESNKRLYMRTTSSYRFNSGDSGAHRFQVVAESSNKTALRITNVVRIPTRGGAMAFSYGLTADAATTVEIAKATGGTIRRLQQSAPSRSGLNSISWDMRDGSGEPVTPGAYILQMTARTEEGETVKAIHPVIIAR